MFFSPSQGLGLGQRMSQLSHIRQHVCCVDSNHCICTGLEGKGVTDKLLLTFGLQDQPTRTFVFGRNGGLWT